MFRKDLKDSHGISSKKPPTQNKNWCQNNKFYIEVSKINGIAASCLQVIVGSALQY